MTTPPTPPTSLVDEQFVRCDGTHRGAVFLALGAVSACWSNLRGAGTFLSSDATRIGEELIRFLGVAPSISRDEAAWLAAVLVQNSVPREPGPMDWEGEGRAYAERILRRIIDPHPEPPVLDVSEPDGGYVTATCTCGATARILGGHDEALDWWYHTHLQEPRDAEDPPSVGRVVRYRFICPWCRGWGVWASEERCQVCHGSGLTDDESPGIDLHTKHPPGVEPPEVTPEPIPRPPGVMRQPCTDCAYRPGSPEGDYLRLMPGPDDVFYCHHGLIRRGDGYLSGPTVAGRPLGAMVCSSWWAQHIEGGAPPTAAFRDPGGSDRSAVAEQPPGGQRDT